MSIHVCNCGDEWHLRYPGLSKAEAQAIADKINSGTLTSVEQLQKQVAMLRNVLVHHQQQTRPIHASMEALLHTQSAADAWLAEEKAKVFEQSAGIAIGVGQFENHYGVRDALLEKAADIRAAAKKGEVK